MNKSLLPILFLSLLICACSDGVDSSASMDTVKLTPDPGIYDIQVDLLKSNTFIFPLTTKPTTPVVISVYNSDNSIIEQKQNMLYVSAKNVSDGEQKTITIGVDVDARDIPYKEPPRQDYTFNVTYINQPLFTTVNTTLGNVTEPAAVIFEKDNKVYTGYIENVNLQNTTCNDVTLSGSNSKIFVTLNKGAITGNCSVETSYNARIPYIMNITKTNNITFSKIPYLYLTPDNTTLTIAQSSSIDISFTMNGGTPFDGTISNPSSITQCSGLTVAPSTSDPTKLTITATSSFDACSSALISFIATTANPLTYATNIQYITLNITQ